MPRAGNAGRGSLPSPIKMTGWQPERTVALRGGLGKTLGPPVLRGGVPGSPHRAKAAFVRKVKSRWPAVGKFRPPVPASRPDVQVCTAESEL